MLPFRELWQAIRERLSVGTEIAYWRKNDSANEKTFRIERLNYDEVAVSSHGITGIRSISRKDFETIYASWEDYKADKIKRTDVVERSRNSSYILSIFHWFEEQAEGR